MAVMALTLMVSLAASGTVLESSKEPLFPQVRQLSDVQLDRAEAASRYGHPNEMWRYRALRARKQKQPERAAGYFRQAGSYADKYSQHALSLMYWHGVGVGQDRAQAYVWADLAAERGYQDLLVLREKMWLEMDAAQRTQALLVGEKMYALYGDAAAKPRMEQAMRRALASVTGSRVGATLDSVRVMVLDDKGKKTGADISERALYAPQRWNAKAYWQEQNRQWDAKVIVLPPEPADAQPAPAARGEGRPGP